MHDLRVNAGPVVVEPDPDMGPLMDGFAAAEAQSPLADVARDGVLACAVKRFDDDGDVPAEPRLGTLAAVLGFFSA
jgi:hypothetical protein